MRTRALHMACLWAFLGAACGDGGSPANDAGPDRDGSSTPGDARPNQDGIAPLTWVDFTIAGCSNRASPSSMDPLDAGVPEPCVGVAPLTLEFTALSPAPIDVYLWGFGDGGEADVAAPKHVYETPGAYDVSLVVGGPGGTANVVREGIVIVEPASLGASCDSDPQCADELGCVCDAETECPPSLAQGLCSRGCAAGNPCAEGECANLAPAEVTDAADWQRALCLPGCEDESACPAGLVCRELRNGVGSGWVHACFVEGLLGAIGAPCVDADGDLDNAACASGRCLAEGARGMCSDPCTSGSCPGSAACATFSGAELGSYCLARCESIADCSDDPWLACQAPGGDGDKAFTVDETPSALGYCAPRACDGGDECGADGDCVEGFCGPT